MNYVFGFDLLMTKYEHKDKREYALYSCFWTKY